MQPNILFVVLDTARLDLLDPIRMPALDQLSRRGTAVSNAYSAASWTLPSHASMFTGLLPRSLGVGQAPGGSPQSARPSLERVSERMLANVLRDAGYATRGWSTNLWVSPLSGFDIGFEALEYLSSDRIERMESLTGAGVRAQLAWAREGLRSSSDDGAARACALLRQSISAWSGRPTFWFANLNECHSPYLPPRPWNDLDPWDRVLAALDAKRHMTFESICLYIAGRHDITDASLERMHHLYERSAAYVDSLLGGVLDALDDKGLLDETLVIVTSDHGENFGERGLIAHGFSVDQRLVHVPLVMAGPGAIDDDRVFSLLELPSLAADAAGIAASPFGELETPKGIAVAQYDRLAPPEDPTMRAAAEKWGLDDEAVARIATSYECATDGTYKLVASNGHRMLYDLRSDPDELNPLSAQDGGDAFAKLERALSGQSSADGDAAPNQSAQPAPSPDELEAIERQMKLLGYM